VRAGGVGLGEAGARARHAGSVAARGWRVANGMTIRQEVKVRPGALTEGTRHRRDKCVGLENQSLSAGRGSIAHATEGPRGDVWWKS
jgi:hypothetical protein